MLKIKETWTEVQNKNTENEKSVIYGASDWYEPFTENIKQLFKSLQHEYGRCTGKVYKDVLEQPERINKTFQVGWVFQKKSQYDDTGRYGRKPEFYIQETWVSLSEPIKQV